MRIIYLDIDSLRPDHLGCYGYHRNTSPNINSIAAQGVRLTNVHCSDAPCLPSRTAMYTGRFGIHTGVVSHGGTAADPHADGASRGAWDTIEETCLPRLLQERGYHTAMISPFGQRHAARHFYAGFHEIHNTGKNGMESAEEVTPLVEKWLRDHAREDHWFLHLNYWDPHTPYRTPPDYPNKFENDPLPAWLTEEVFARHREKVGPHSAREINMFDNAVDSRFPKHPGELHTMEDLRQMIDGYDTAVRYVDDQVGRILKLLNEAGIADDTAIIVSADHGENLGELGIYGEHATADAITTRIPMIIKWPGKTNPGAVVGGLHYNLDLAPTIAELLGTEPKQGWDGISYANTLQGEASAGREFLVVSQCAHVCQRSVRFEDWIYIRTYDDGYHLFPKEMLFNLADDPHEQHDLAPTRRDVCDRAIRHLSDWHDAMMSTGKHPVDPLWTVMLEHGLVYNRGKLEAYCERLEATDRGWAVAELRQRHPHEFKPTPSHP